MIVLSKAGNCQLCAGCLTIDDVGRTEQNDKTGKCTDHDRIHEYLKNTEHALMDSIVRICAGMGDGTGTKAGFIGKNTAGDAFFHA